MRPTVIGHYNKHMGGVDLFDQLIQYYPFVRRSKRWTQKLLKYLLQLALQNAYILYSTHTTDRRPMTHVQFLDLAGHALVFFKPADWPSITGPLPRADDLPVNLRADSFRQDYSHLRRRRNREGREGESSDDEEVVDQPAATGSQMMPPPAAPPATATATADAPAAMETSAATAATETSAATAATASTSAAASHGITAGDIAAASAAAASAPPSAAPAFPDPPGPVLLPPHSAIDPPCRLQPGDHTLVPLAKRRQRRCRVCHMNGKRRDSHYVCRTCKVALCRVNAECSRSNHSKIKYWSTPPRGTREGAANRRRAFTSE